MAMFELGVEFSSVSERPVELYFNISSETLMLNSTTTLVLLSPLLFPFCTTEEPYKLLPCLQASGHPNWELVWLNGKMCPAAGFAGPAGLASHDAAGPLAAAC